MGYNPTIPHLQVGYNPFTNHVLTSWKHPSTVTLKTSFKKSTENSLAQSREENKMVKQNPLRLLFVH